ncbi:hypothetical protein NL676_029109 [Syzygium grande]|nr:hypothetical protein NL676_029109 [Syzygium grande]
MNHNFFYGLLEFGGQHHFFPYYIFHQEVGVREMATAPNSPPPAATANGGVTGATSGQLGHLLRSVPHFHIWRQGIEFGRKRIHD